MIFQDYRYALYKEIGDITRIQTCILAPGQKRLNLPSEDVVHQRTRGNQSFQISNLFMGRRDFPWREITCRPSSFLSECLGWCYRRPLVGHYMLAALLTSADYRIFFQEVLSSIFNTIPQHVRHHM